MENNPYEVDVKTIQSFKTEDYTEYEKMFKSMDTDKSGFIEKGELLKVMHNLGYRSMVEEDLTKILAEIDLNKQGPKSFLQGVPHDDEERERRTRINSLGLEGVHINNLYEECRSGLLLLTLIDKIKPGTVNWKMVDKNAKNPFKVAVNCNEVINASKKSGYSIVGI